jgi:rod shape-determining protein MreC
VAATRHTSQRLTLLMLVLASITVLTLDYHGEASRAIGHVRSGVADVFAPLQRGVAAALHPLGDVVSGSVHYGELETVNAQLRAEIGSLQRQASLDHYTLAAAEQITVLNRLPFVQVPSVPAEVISEPSSNFDHTIEIHLGTSSGIGPGMPVVGDAGLVGTVLSASSSYATVQLLTDPRSTIGVRVGSSFFRATGTGRALDLQTLETGSGASAPRAGDRAVTSGQDNGAYPPSIPVGVISSVAISASGVVSTITLTPLVNLSTIQYVSVLQWLPPA